MVNGNYPDDIHNYSHDPRSPLYDGPEPKSEDELYEAELEGIKNNESEDLFLEAIESNEKAIFDAAEMGDSDKLLELINAAQDSYAEKEAARRVEKDILQHAKEY